MRICPRQPFFNLLHQKRKWVQLFLSHWENKVHQLQCHATPTRVLVWHYLLSTQCYFECLRVFRQPVYNRTLGNLREYLF